MRKTDAKNATERLLDEAYLLILTRRPSPSGLAAALGVPMSALDRILHRLSKALAQHDLRVASPGAGARKQLQIEALGGPNGKPVAIGPESLKVRKLPARLPRAEGR